MNFLYATGDRPLDGYTIRKPIGHGGFGEVYHAVSDGGKESALKLVQRHLEVELRGVRQCLNVKHQNLVSVFDVRETPAGENWIVMEFVDGESLADVLDKHPQGLDVKESLRWLMGIIDGVDHLHRSGVVHRDIKPSNLFDDRGIIKVGDYSLSKFITSSKRSGQTQSIGTVHYMAPEIGSGRYGREVDVYAVGVVLYEMLVGEVPFSGETATEVLMKHLTAAPDLSKVPNVFRGILARMLAKNPDERYSSLAAVRAELEARLEDATYEADAPISKNEAPLPQQSWKSSPQVTADYQHTSPYTRVVRSSSTISLVIREHPFMSVLLWMLVMVCVGIPVVLSWVSRSPIQYNPVHTAFMPAAAWTGFTMVSCFAFLVFSLIWRSVSPTEKMQLRRSQSRGSLPIRMLRGLSVSMRESPALWAVCLSLSSMLFSPIGGQLLVETGVINSHDVPPMVWWCFFSLVVGFCLFMWMLLWRTACPPPSVWQRREIEQLRLDAALRETHRDRPTPPVPVQQENAQSKTPVTFGKKFLIFLNQLQRSSDDYWIGGVCGGLGKYTPVPSWVWRLICLSLLPLAGSGAAIYFALMLCIPEEAENSPAKTTKAGLSFGMVPKGRE